MPGADGMSAKFMKNAFVGWTFTAGVYYPPDYDPSKLLPIKHLKARGESREKLMNIRMMFPFTMVCDACGEYNYTGTKFTSRVETIKTESYLGLKVYRFYGRCKHCWSEFTFKTDPKNSDYTMESGGKRTYEAWKDADMAEAQLKTEKENAEKDQMKALEQKSIDVQAEMQRIEDLDAIRTLNKRGGHRDQSIEEALEFLFKKAGQNEEKEDILEGDEVTELEGFMEAQELKKRQALDDEVENGTRSAAASSSSGPVDGSKTAGASGSSGVNAAFGSSSSSTASATEKAIAAAVAERASQAASKPAVGARFTVKRKAPEPSPSPESESKDDAKRPCAAIASAGSSAQAAATGSVTPAASGGGLGLGDYASDSS